MTGDLLQLLEKIATASSEVERDHLLMEFTLNSLPEKSREAVKAAAVPHWFDKEFLAVLLQQSVEEKTFSTLLDLSFVEVYPERGYCVHERSRNTLLHILFEDYPLRFRSFSRYAAEYSKQQDGEDPLWRIEAIYHQLIAEPVNGVKLLQNTGWEWLNSPNFAYHKVEALARAAREHLNADRLTTEGVSWTLLLEAHLDIVYSRGDRAKERLEKIQITQETDDYTTANYFQELGDVNLIFSKASEAQECYQQALTYYCKINSKQGQANCLNALSEVSLALSEFSQAQQHCEQALTLYLMIGDEIGVANSFKILGDLRLKFSDLSEAQEHYQQALARYQTLGAKLKEANCLRALGDVYLKLAEVSKAGEYYEQALAFYRKIGNKLGEANCLKSLGDVYSELSEVSKAGEYYEQALAFYRKIGNKLGEADCLRSLGDVHLGFYEVSKAGENYEQALALYEEIGDKYDEAGCLKSLSNWHKIKGEYNTAWQYYQRAEDLLLDIGIWKGEQGRLEGIAELYEEQGNVLPKTVNNALESVVLVTGSVSQRFGTGFAIYSKPGETWIVTCAHVVENVGGVDNVRVDGKQAKVLACGKPEGLDLAVLSVRGIEISPLTLGFTGRKDMVCNITGFAKVTREVRRAESMQATLGSRVMVRASEGPTGTAWELWTKGETSLKEGYSGSPVILAGTRTAFAVVTHRGYQGEHGYAVSLAHLPEIWRELPVELFGTHPLMIGSPAGGRRESLEDLFKRLPVSDEELRRMCHLAMPPNEPHEIPLDSNRLDLLEWLLERGKLTAGQVPLLKVLQQLLPLALNANTREIVVQELNQIAHYYGVTDNQPIPELGSVRIENSLALMLEIWRTSSKARFNVHGWLFFSSERIFSVYVREGINSLNLDDKEDLTGLVTDLHEILAGHGLDQSNLIIEFILPWNCCLWQ